jgi:hypothetical protein
MPSTHERGVDLRGEFGARVTLALTASESRWIGYIRENVVGRLEGDDAERARTAAIVAWWSLKEGILDLPNPLRHNLCSAAGEQQIGDLAVCPRGAWQIGISGIQGGAVNLAETEAAARRLYPGKSFEAILERVAVETGVEGNAVDAIRNAMGDLRKAWLLRDGAIGFTLQKPFVERGCLSGSASWCYGGWDTARRFASGDERIREIVGDLETYFRGASTPKHPERSAIATILVLAGLVGLGYWAYREGYVDGAFRGARRAP